MAEARIVGGLPTEPDVKALMEHFRDIKEGQSIDHGAIGVVIRAAPESSRYRTVVSAWRRALLRERNIRLRAVPGSGFEVLTDSERLRENVKGFAGVARKTRRVVDDTDRIDAAKLSPVERVGRDHLSRLGRAQLDAARNAQRQIAVALNPPKQLPRAAPSTGSMET